MNNYVNDAAAAAAGDQNAFARLYETSYKDMYYVALKYMKNETEAEDVLQEAYIRAWKNIHTLKDPAAFPGWLSRIVANQAKNALVRKNPMLFSQMGDEEDDGDFSFDVADERIESQPELNYTQQETAELVKEMVDSLSDEQRLCVLMFYYENQSVSEISNALNVSENTVKSRLNYGRKNLNKKAEELKKKGYKLYSVSGLALLLLLFHKEKVSAAVLDAASVSMKAGESAVLSSAAGTGAAGAAATTSSAAASTAAAGAAAAKTGAAAAFIHTAAGKAAVVIACVVLAGGGATAGVIAANHTPKSSQSQNASATEVTEKTTETTTEETTTTSGVRELSDAEYPEYIDGNLTKEEFAYVLSAIGEHSSDYLSEGLTEGRLFGLLNELVQTQAGLGKSMSLNAAIAPATYDLDTINRYFRSFSHYQFTTSGMLYTIAGDTIVLNTEATVSYDSVATIQSAAVDGDTLTVNYSLDISKYGEGEDVHTNLTATLTRTDDGLYRVTSIS